MNELNSLDDYLEQEIDSVMDSPAQNNENQQPLSNLSTTSQNNENKQPLQTPKPEQEQESKNQSDLANQMVSILLQSICNTANNENITLENLPTITKGLGEEEKEKIVHGLKFIPNCSIKSMLSALIMTHPRPNHMNPIPNKKTKLLVPDTIEWKSEVYTKVYSFRKAMVHGYQSREGLSILICTDEDYIKQLKTTIIMVSNSYARAALVLETTPPMPSIQTGIIQLCRDLSKRSVKLFIEKAGQNSKVSQFKTYDSESIDGKILVLHGVNTIFNT